MPDTQPMEHPQQFPRFNAIELDQIEPQLLAIIHANRQALTELVRQTNPSWTGLMKAWEALEDRLSAFWSPVQHLHAVKNSDALREVYQRCLDHLTQYATEVGHNQALFEAVQRLSEQHSAEDFDASQRQVIHHALRDFKLQGVHLPHDEKTQHAALEARLSHLHTQFEQNLLDASQQWYLAVAHPEPLAGLPDVVKATAKETAQAKGLDGWVLTLDEPCYIAVMTHAENPDTRKTCYEARLTRASDLGPHAGQWDNGPVMAEILHNQQKLAQLLGYAHYAEYSLATKMAETPDQVETFLNDIAERAITKARTQWQALVAFANEHFGRAEIQPWDIAFYNEKLRQSRFNFTDEDLRPYFQLEAVLDGLFYVTDYLFGLTVTPAQPPDTWHPDVRFYAVHDETGQKRGYFYLDLYARQGKRGGAWMDECRVRRKTPAGELQYPVAYLTCNCQPPIEGQPALLTHDEVVTLFHEFGHTLQHVATQVDHCAVSGINGVPWDAVEFPSQLMEHWAWQQPVLRRMGRHFETGEPLPEPLMEQLIASRHFNSALGLCRQLEFALFDWHLHTTSVLEADQTTVINTIQAKLDEARSNVRVTPVASFDRFQNGFAHLFSGAYAAGYYSYLWAEVLASDAFAKFEENGLWDKTVGRDFRRCILETGGSDTPQALFEAFRGRSYSVEPLLRHYGIADDRT